MNKQKISLMADSAAASSMAKTCIRSDLSKYKPSLILDNNFYIEQ